MSERTVELEILRYDPEQDDSPHFQTYTVPYNEDWVVLDAINYIKDELDRTLSYRWSCHMAVCGSCGMVINGEPVLSCHAFLRDYPGKIRVEPLQNFPIERDLVVVIDDFIDKLGSVKPYIVAKKEKDVGDGEYLQTPAELARFKQYRPASTACFVIPPARNTRLMIPSWVRRRWRSRIDTTSTRAMLAVPRGKMSSPATRASGSAVSWAPARKYVQSPWILPPRYNKPRLRAPAITS
jgi:succinate dehydrogenase/fumarate reductase iron-sulfur protein